MNSTQTVEDRELESMAIIRNFRIVQLEAHNSTIWKFRIVQTEEK